MGHNTACAQQYPVLLREITNNKHESVEAMAQSRAGLMCLPKHGLRQVRHLASVPSYMVTAGVRGCLDITGIMFHQEISHRFYFFCTKILTY